MAHIQLLIKLAFLLLATVLAVDQNKFKKCEQSSFCRRCRNLEPGNSPYYLDLKTLQVSDGYIEAELINEAYNAKFKFILYALEGSMFRVWVDQPGSLFPRYKVNLALEKDPQLARLKVDERNENLVSISFGDNKAVVHAKPFKVEFYKGNKLVVVANARGLLNFEHHRKKDPEEDGGETKKEEDPGTWEENFQSHHDSKPRGPEAVALDFTFPGAERAYGLPEHADKLALRSTGRSGLDPYRLFNLDVFEYELNNPMALYGSIPVVYAHGPERTVGVYWQNAAETWVDVVNSKDANVVASLVSLVSGGRADSKVDVHFMSESGVLDTFVLMGPTPVDAVKQFARLTGTAPLPQYFSLAYHQSRWNYNDETDVRQVVQNFDLNDMPLDVMWLDIEYTDGKKYFTWDESRFPHPEEMQKNLTALGRKLVVIIDPHIKRDDRYFFHSDCLANDYYIKNKDGQVYEGWCWPGSSSYPDFFDPVVSDYYSGQYALGKFPGATNDMYIWNDMNEPSVFNGPEVTMPKDCLHYGNWEHRHVHNLYGFVHTKATFDGLLARSQKSRRPFILTRAFFAGSQRYVAMWTGDNTADWGHLAISYPMCLTSALAGLSFCGADIGGFFGNPDAELLTRWYQAGAWLPFYRAHAHIDTKRREPFLFSDDVKNRIRKALQQRYQYLPYWYTLFYEHEHTGEPVIRPLFYQYPKESDTFTIDDELLIGSAILAHPVTEPGASTVTVYLPGGSNEYWFDIETFKKYTGTGNINLPVSIDKVPVFQKGGTIVPRRDRPRRASTLTHNDPYTLSIALDDKGTASGFLYIDDGESYMYRNKQYMYHKMEFKDNKLTSTVEIDVYYPTKAWLERVIILNPPKGIKSALVVGKGVDKSVVDVLYDDEGTSLTVRKPGVSMTAPFSIKLQTE